MAGVRLSRLVMSSGSAASALALTAVLAAPASASTGWHLVSEQHFGSSTSYDGLASVVAPAASQAWAFGGVNLQKFQEGAPLAERWNGSRWRVAALPENTGWQIAAASAPATNDVWAVSGLGGYALHWNGAKWIVARKWPVNTSLPAELTGVTAFSPTDVWVFGGSGMDPGLGTWHLHGKTWTHVTGAGANLDEASALSPTDMWAIGGVNGSYNAVFHYDGTAWKQVAAPALAALSVQGILALSPTDIWLAAASTGNSAKPELLHFTGGRWRVVTPPWNLLLTNLTADGRGGFWAAGHTFSSNSVWAVHMSAAGKWSRQEFTTGGPGAFALIPGGTSMWGAGEKKSGSVSAAAIWRH